VLERLGGALPDLFEMTCHGFRVGERVDDANLVGVLVEVREHRDRARLVRADQLGDLGYVSLQILEVPLLDAAAADEHDRVRHIPSPWTARRSVGAFLAPAQPRGSTDRDRWTRVASWSSHLASVGSAPGA
jgi:hypothetical protein